MILGFGNMEVVDHFDKVVAMEEKPDGTECKTEAEELGNIWKFTMKGSREIWDSRTARVDSRGSLFFIFTFFFNLEGRMTWLYADGNNPSDRKN